MCPQQVGRGRVEAGVGCLFDRLVACLVEQRHRLLHAADDGLGDRGLAERHGVVGKGFEERHAAGRRLRELLRGQLEPVAVREEAGTPRMPLREPLDFAERRRVLLPLRQPVELLQIAHEFGAAELDLLAGAAGARRVGVEGHAGAIS